MSITRITLDELQRRSLSQEQLKEIEALNNMNDEDIDFSDIPASTASDLKQFKRAHSLSPNWFQEINNNIIHLDYDVLEALKAKGKENEKDVNEILRHAIAQVQ